MKRANRILLGFTFLALLIVSWIIAASAKSNVEKQLGLMENAAKLMDDLIYVRAIPLLEEAASYDTEHTFAAEAELKKAYLALSDKHGYHRKYVDLLEKQLERDNVPPEIYAEAAKYYIKISKTPTAIATLKTGIEKTGDAELVSFYESVRYEYETSRDIYEYASAIHGSTSKVRKDGKWGIAKSDGTLLIPCEYEMISTYSGGSAVVYDGSEIYAVDQNNCRVAKLHENILGFGNYAENRIALHFDEGWRRASGDFTVGNAAFEDIGTYSGGYAAAKSNGKWGVIDIGTNWLIPAECDAIIQDELGRCHARGAVFARKGSDVYLYVDGRQIGDTYEDARPFTKEGFAAVKKNGKWGFIDTTGTVALDFTFDDALSFSQNLAAVKQDDCWGYIDASGKIVIDPIFIEAKTFVNGSAPVQTDRGWRFITLLEYKSDAAPSLLG